MNSFFSSIYFVLTRLPVYISLALKLFSKQNNIFRQRQIIGRGQFSNKIPAGGRLYKKSWRPLVHMAREKHSC